MDSSRGPLKILNDVKLILDDQGNYFDSYVISLKSFKSFRGSLICKPVTGQELFFAVSYSKLALVMKKLSNCLPLEISIRNVPGIQARVGRNLTSDEAPFGSPRDLDRS